MTAQEKELMTMIARLAPQFHQLTSEVLFGQVWQDDTLSQRDRSLITVTALVVLITRPPDPCIEQWLAYRRA
ncbi:carboxymuconolactone decarboxylase family protein [Vibrio rhizosphaerae]|uniref:carboxymuconolactone decarboxylase family protein n=1 Tax=Vibrio rhizosphaerae TaxID=398736 RepID=UPI000B127DE8|nr:carboxymuconolactone decarboxylase family protein [Vibrio rhizosphaerae]